MAIIVLLFSLVAVGVERVRSKGAQAATEALIQRLQQYLDEYKTRTGHYPPDGIDYPVETDDGDPIRCSACLYYFLASKATVIKEIRAGKEFIKEAREPIAKFAGRELSPEDADAPGVREILDGWGTPFHYDNTEDGKFEPQDGAAHMNPLEDDEHPPDPRTGDVVIEGVKAVEVPGIQGAGTYDIWSHGKQGHETDEAPTLPIASWNLR